VQTSIYAQKAKLVIDQSNKKEDFFVSNQSKTKKWEKPQCHHERYSTYDQSEELEKKIKMGDENQSFDGIYFLLSHVECGPIMLSSINIMINFVCREKMRGSCLI